MKITAIHGGSDWADASAEYIVLLEGMNIEEEKKAYRTWYEKEYVPALRADGKPQYITFVDWLISKGARKPSDDELEIVEDW